jgi:hypothetical protein
MYNKLMESNKKITKAKEYRLSRQSVKKHVAAIHTSGELSLLERKMANVLLLNAYDELLTKRTHTIPVKLFAAMLGWDESHNTERLQSSLERLASTTVVFDLMGDGKESWAVVSMISFGEIKNGLCTYRYDEYLAEKMYDPEIYATINLGIQRQIKGGYSLTLYENCLRYKNVGSTGWWEISKFRKLIGAENEYYNDFRRLNSKVIKPSVEEINKSSDILVDPEFKRESRKVVAIRFTVKEVSQSKLLIKDQSVEINSVRETDFYKRLREHGIGDKLAIAWIRQDAEKVSAIIDYVEEKDRKKEVKGSTAGYIRKLIEEGADVGVSQYKAEKEQKERHDMDEKKKTDTEAQFKRAQTTKKIQSLTIENKKNFATEYVEEV